MTLTETDVARLEKAGFSGFSWLNRVGDLELVNRNGRCVFFDGGDCSVYSLRPDGCRLYPLIMDIGSGRVVLDEFCPHRVEFPIYDDDAAEVRRSVAQENSESLKRRQRITGRLRRRFRAIAAVVVSAASVVGCAQSSGGERQVEPPSEPVQLQPWEWWRDLATIAVVPEGDRVVMRSSHCPSGCEQDRHSAGDSRFLRVTDSGEGVIFSADGAGAVTRIWMVMGDGISEPLDGTIRLRVRIDGGWRPVVDLSLPELFGGETPPFLEPLVADGAESGGGHVSYVPIPFRDGCEITLVGAEEAKIWFQVAARTVEDAATVRSFTGGEPLSTLRTMLGRSGGDPWPNVPSQNVSQSVVLEPGDGEVVATLEGPDVINGILVRAQRDHWPRLGLRLTFDDQEPQLIPLMDFFGVLNTDGGLTRSLFVGADGDNDLYCYFPMPFFRRAVVEIMRRPVEGPVKVEAEIAIRKVGLSPPENAGYFKVSVRTNYRKEIVPGEDLTVFEVDGRGKWIGLITRMYPSDRRDWAHLEGDEKVFIDGDETPSWWGTGVEDFFNGGFYFRDQTGNPTPFSEALAGAPDFNRVHFIAVMYRLLLGDAVVFHDGVRVDLETGSRSETKLRARTVAYYYLRPGDQPSP